MYCGECGKQIEDAWKNCPFCGKQISGNTMSMQASVMEEIQITDEMQSNSENKKKKRVIKWCVAVIVVIAIAIVVPIWSSYREMQIDLLTYINESIVEIGEIENEFIESYESVSGENYVSDAEMYEELKDNTLPLVRELNNEAIDVIEEIDEEEIRDVHSIYLDYSNKCLNAIVTIMSALENQDYDEVAEANNLMNEATKLGIEFTNELENLADKYNVEILRR